MLTLSELCDQALVFLDKGGPALWVILLVSLLLWLLLLERCWYLTFDFPSLRDGIARRWQPFQHRKSRYSKRLRATLLNELQHSAGRYMRTIAILTQTLPLLGLLGTVSGMIQTFDVIAIYGNGNARGLAGGISQALLTTMSGLVTALSGLYFGANLNQKVQLALEQAEAELD
ncbi:MAG: MotA/TolQ/ExbB proton channel family protein [Gammaproteobacteria bacterium]